MSNTYHPCVEAHITEAGELNAKYIIHTVGPMYYDHKNPALALENAYRHSLQLAISHQCQSIAFPAISCGIYRYPPAQAATIAISVCNEAAFKQLDISFYLFDQSVANIWQQALAATK
ncbi:macro domain-containing protein [Photobacterium damselae]|uniref:macro domain-containing protein n=1 Tax=Photobacterium damselae TaxID=38293 RepID=UPI00226CD728|nr:macro domain-containing protein [Photobacterium damselae]